MSKKILFTASLISLLPVAQASNVVHNFNVGGGLGWHNSQFTYNIVEYDQPTSTNRKFDLSKSTGAGNLAVGYAVKLHKIMMGVDLDYLFASTKKEAYPASISDGSFAYRARVRSKGAFGSVVKLGYYVKDDLVGYIGAGIERRQFKIQYAIQDRSQGSIEKKHNSVSFAARLGFDYTVNKNLTAGLEYRKAFHNSKNYVNNNTTLKFRPHASDTVLLNLRLKLNLSQGKTYNKSENR